MYKQFYQNRLLFLLFPLFLLFSIFSGFRPISDYSVDTTSYINFFLAIDKFSYNDLNLNTELFEPGFVILTYLISRLTSNYHVYLSIIFVIFNLSLFLFFYKLIHLLKIGNSEIFLIILIGFTLSSDWYNNFSYNGLRQGLSAPFLYISILYIFKKKYFKSILFLFLALSFHKSVLFVIIFFPILFFNNKYTILIYLLMGLIYFLDLSKFLVFYISQFLNLPLYALVSEYGGDDALYKGFSFKFFFYSFFLVLFFLAINFTFRKYFSFSNILNMNFLFKMYSVLIGPFFLLGYSGYSNRYAIFGWFFIPIIYSVNFENLKIKKNEKVILIFFIFVFSVYKNLAIYF
jgi:hypothetical protein